jgi:AcrR family transcriptional regulator
LRIFAQDGDASATVERIAAEAGISARTFHRHFPAKEDVVRPLFRESAERQIAALRRAPRTGDVVDSLVDALLSQFHHEALTTDDRTFLGLVSRIPEFRLRWLEVDDELCAAVTDFLAERISLDPEPQLRPLPALLVVQTTRYVLDRWLLGDPASQVDPLLRRGLRLVFDGLHPGAEPAPARVAHG